MTLEPGSYQQRLDATVAELDRWIEEAAAGQDLRGTLAFGIAAKALRHFERLVVARLEQIAPSPTEAEVPNRVTLGQMLDRLRALDRSKRIDPNRRTITRGTGELLNSISSRRNDLAHGREVDPIVLLHDLRRVVATGAFTPNEPRGTT